MVSTADLQRLTSLAEVQHLSQELIAAERSCGVDLDGILARRSQIESSFLLLKAPIAQVRARVHALGASVHALCPISPPTTPCTRIALPLTQSCGADPCAYAPQAAALRFRAIACVRVHAHTGGLPTACSTTLPAHRTWMWCAPTASSCWATRRARRSWQTTSVARYLGGRPCLLCIDRMRRWLCPASLLLQAGPGSDVGSIQAPSRDLQCLRPVLRARLCAALVHSTTVRPHVCNASSLSPQIPPPTHTNAGPAPGPCPDARGGGAGQHQPHPRPHGMHQRGAGRAGGRGVRAWGAWAVCAGQSRVRPAALRRVRRCTASAPRGLEPSPPDPPRTGGLASWSPTHPSPAPSLARAHSRHRTMSWPPATYSRLRTWRPS